MSDSSNELKKKILTGKQALSNNYIDLAIQAFQEASNTRVTGSTFQNSLIGIAQAYLLLVLGIKGDQEDNSTAIQITKALNLLPDETDQLEAYIFLLIDIGKGLRRISFFESSSLVYKKALRYAQTQGAEGDLKMISTISSKLAFSYQKLGKIESAAKLYRIAADLDQDSKNAVTLYYFSAFQYYKAGMKEEALNIFQTAFDKAGILNQINLQYEIAEFQGIISFEIFKERDPNDLFSPFFEYLDIAFDKFTFINDSDWLTRIESERTLLSARTGKSIEISSTSEKTSQPRAISWETRSSEKIRMSENKAFGKDLTETIEMDNSSPISVRTMEYLDESTRTFDNFTKINSENIESGEIAELSQADKALSDEPSAERSQSISSYDRLFPNIESISTEDSSSSIIQLNDSKSSDIVQKIPILGTPILSEVSNMLQKAGWIVHTNISNEVKGSDPDIIAEKGLVRKKRKMIFFAEDVSDAEICSFILQSNQDTGEKYVFLLSGDPKKATISRKVKLITRVDQIF